MTETTTVAVIDDHPLYRSGVVRTIVEAPDLQVAGEGGSADDAVELARRVRPTLMLLDISMPGGGIEAIDRIRAVSPDTAILMLTSSERDDDIMRALEAGARGYVLKGIGGYDLLSVVRTVAGGGSYVSPSLAGRLLVAMRNGTGATRQASPIDSLTKREEQILRLVAEGKSNKEVGRSLDLQEKTVKHYMTTILNKLQARNRTEAAIIAREGGL
ncbi:MAG: response regulator transcription factor [Rhodobiaceae bacterium]|nr:response regulator transcription factor [Rhodobiaceae bacterium]